MQVGVTLTYFDFHGVFEENGTDNPSIAAEETGGGGNDAGTHGMDNSHFIIKSY
jgi:hypothetical protein